MDLASFMAGRSGGGIVTIQNAQPGVVGPGVLNRVALTEFDYFDRLFYYNAADLADKSQTFFVAGQDESYTPLNGVATNQYTKKLVDTNFDLKGQTAYTMKVTGIGVGFGILQNIEGSAGNNDLLQNLTDTLQLYMEDSAIELLINDTVYDRFKCKHAPAGAGPFGALAAATTVAATTLAPSIITNGNPIASNYKNYGSNPLVIPQNNRVKARMVFGPNCLAANVAFKPANTTRVRLWAEVRLIGTRANAVQ